MKTQASKKLVCLLLAFVAVIIFTLITGFTKTTSVSAIETDTEEQSAVVSYTDVFRSYYNTVLKAAEEAGKTDIVSFEEFCDKYYYTGMDLPSYTDAVIRYHVFGDEFDSAPAPEISTFSSSGDAYYILSSTDHNSTPASDFKRIPAYDGFDYSVLQTGDIIHETITTFFTGHTALIYDLSKSSVHGSYIQTIEAVLGGVQFGFLDDTRMVDFGVIILRVNGANNTVTTNAKYFCLMQLGKPYSVDPFRLYTDINEDKWYCSEMVYAAYKYSGIDIGVKDGVYLKHGCLPGDIYNSSNTYTISVHYVYFDIRYVAESWGTHTIKVINNLPTGQTIVYNSKKCFENDAKNWTNLSNIAYKPISGAKSETVDIGNNWLASTFAISLVYKNRCYITYGYIISDILIIKKTSVAI